MDLISWIIFLFVGIRLVVVAYNYISHPYLPEDTKSGEGVSLSILIPARNEAGKLPFLLNDLIANLPSRTEILVYDDLSTDTTAGVVKDMEKRCSFIHLVEGVSLPAGWLGKNHACSRLAEAARGQYLLFLDADVRIEKNFIQRIMSYMRKERLSLLSLFPRQEMPDTEVCLTVPLMNWILLTLLPLAFVRKFPYPSLAAANGQCILFESESYRRIQPHKVMRTNPVEDIAIIKLYKQNNLPVAVLLGSDDISCRMYSGFQESVMGFSKNVFQFFGGNCWLAFGFAFITTFSGLWLFVKMGVTAFLVYLAMIILIRIFFSAASHQSVLNNLILMIPQQIVFWIILVNAYTHSKQRSIVWKERNISQFS